MANAKDFIEAEIQCRQESGEPITSKILSEHIKKISNEIELQRQEAILAEEQKRNRANIIAFYDEVIEEMLTTNQNEYKPNTIKNWKLFGNYLKGFYNETPFTWEEINQALAAQFKAYMERNGYSVNSVCNGNKYFKALIRKAYDQNIHENAKAEKVFVKHQAKESEKAAEVYLTSEELSALYEMKLSGVKDRVRDAFLMGVYTCQRVSDYLNFSKSNVVETTNGIPTLKFTQRKTEKLVQIPISKRLQALLTKYNNESPIISNGSNPESNDVLVNRYIKIILQELSAKVPSLAQDFVTILEKGERENEALGKVTFRRDKYGNVIKHKYELVTSHTARDTGISLLYLKGFNETQIMAMSGHTNLTMSRAYNKMSAEDKAEAIAEKMSKVNPYE